MLVMMDMPVLITPYLPSCPRSDAAVIIFPGGGYELRAEHEGKGYAEFLNHHGIAAFVVNYRVSPDRYPAPFDDACEAIRFVRCHAAELGISPDRVAVMGSSAGGHLAALTATETTDADVPNAQILCYPVICSPSEAGDIAHRGSYLNLIGSADSARERALDPLLHVTDRTPPAFIWHTSDDDCVDVINSYRYATALRTHRIPVEMHIFPSGRHGLGLCPDSPHNAQWGMLLIHWLSFIGWL